MFFPFRSNTNYTILLQKPPTETMSMTMRNTQIDSASSTDAEDSDNDVQIGKFLFVADKLFLLTSH